MDNKRGGGGEANGYAYVHRDWSYLVHIRLGELHHKAPAKGALEYLLLPGPTVPHVGNVLQSDLCGRNEEIVEGTDVIVTCCHLFLYFNDFFVFDGLLPLPPTTAWPVGKLRS
jgi:hypothetical protein